MRLGIERFDEAGHVLARKSANENRFLVIGFAENESAEIGRAIRHEPPSIDTSHPKWMEMIEHRGATLDAVTIVDLVEGVFHARVQLTQLGRSFDLPARPAD